MAAEAVGEEEAGEFGDGSEDRVVVGRHFVEAGPGALGVDLGLLQAGEAVDTAGEDLFDEGAVEIELEAGGLFGVVPGEQESAALGAVVEAGGHVDDHGRGVGDAVEGLGGDEHAAQGFDGEVESGESGDVAGPGAGGIDDGAAGDEAARGFDAGDAARIAGDAGDVGVAHEADAALGGLEHEAGHDAVRVHEAIGGAETAADDVVVAEFGGEVGDVGGGEERNVEPGGDLMAVSFRAGTACGRGWWRRRGSPGGGSRRGGP